MNERIRELAEQAGYTKDMFGFGHWDMPECQKFAELIIADVVEIIKDQRNYNTHIYTTYDADRAIGLAAEIAKAVKQRLG
jgi:hypothetical protein